MYIFIRKKEKKHDFFFYTILARRGRANGEQNGKEKKKNFFNGFGQMKKFRVNSGEAEHKKIYSKKK